MSKKLEDWALKEAKKECKKHISCDGCPLNNKENHCRLKGTAALFDLTEEPAFTVAETQFLEMLNNNGAMFLGRDKNGTVCWFKHKPVKDEDSWQPCDITDITTDEFGYLPNKMFQQVQWSDTSPLHIEEFLSYGK